jgi:hypothetical protein
MTTRWIMLGLVLFLAPFASALFANPAFATRPGIPAAFLVGWVVLVVLGVLGVFVWSRADRARVRELAKTLRARRRDVCRRCGYDLSAIRTDGLCPECGLEFQKFWTTPGIRAAPRESPADLPPNTNGG